MSENSNYKIFLIDDDEFLLDMYTLKFKEAGYQVQGFLDSEQALSKLREGVCPDAIVLDLVMPKLDGYTLLKTIREEHLCNDPILVVLSNQGQESEIEEAKKYNVDGYILKASNIPSDVLQKVVAIIKERKQNAHEQH